MRGENGKLGLNAELSRRWWRDPETGRVESRSSDEAPSGDLSEGNCLGHGDVWRMRQFG